jgi:predicted dehydrogenase
MERAGGGCLASGVVEEELMRNRRTFLKRSLAAGAVASLGPVLSPGCAAARRRVPAGAFLRHACIGVGGMGAADMGHIATHPLVSIDALCDVDERTLLKAAIKFPRARVYSDWRELLFVEKGRLDSVSVSTPDHMHAPIGMQAMRQGLHVYGQKPLSHTVLEARRMAETANRMGVVTQMGIQNHSGRPFRSALEVFQRGVTGPVHEVHVWTDRPAGWWAQGTERPGGSDPIPTELDWNAWLGVAPVRPYKASAYHTFDWRGYQDFGTGAQGDMGCHLMDPVPWFLGLLTPRSIRSEGPAPNGETFPTWSEVHYDFDAVTSACHPDGVRVVWHDGGRRPDELLDEWHAGDSVYSNAALLVGHDAALLVSPYEDCRLLTRAGERAVDVPRVPEVDHWHQWVDACFGHGQPTTPFSYAGPLTEIALLGNIALEHPGQRLAWDGPGLRFPDQPSADRLLHKTYRRGWSVHGL